MKRANRAALLFVVVFASFGISRLSSVRANSPVPPGKIAFVQNGSVWQWSNGDTQELVKGSNLSDARWSPSGDLLLYVKSGNSYSDLYTYDLAGQTETQLTFNKPDAQEGSPEYAAAASWAIDPSWSASGVIGYSSDAQSQSNTLALWLFDSVYSGAPHPASIAGNADSDNIYSVSVSPDGSVAAYVEQTHDYSTGISSTSIELRDLTNGQVYPLTQAGAAAFDPAIGPDGQTIAYASRDASGMTDVWILNRQGGSPVRITNGFQATSPVWAPDGSYLAFIRMIDFGFQVWVAPMTGSQPGTPFELFSPDNLDATSGLSWSIPAAAS